MAYIIGIVAVITFVATAIMEDSIFSWKEKILIGALTSAASTLTTLMIMLVIVSIMYEDEYEVSHHAVAGTDLVVEIKVLDSDDWMLKGYPRKEKINVIEKIEVQDE